MLNAKITGIASYVPDYVLNNDELAHMVDTSDEWITTRVGIKERRIYKGEGGSSVLGIKAVNKLLAETGTNPDDVELLICATCNPDYRFPSTGSMICHGTGLEKNCYSFDVEAACAGFIVGIQMANAYIKAGLYKKVIVVCAENLTSAVDYTDRATCPLFGDGAGAVLMEPTEDTSLGLIDSVFHVDGSGLENLKFKAGGSAYPTTMESVEKREHYLYQEGRAVYKNAVMDMYNSSLTIMERNGLTCDNIDWFVAHQATMRIIEAVGSRMGIDPSEVLVNIDHIGNTSAASIPICLDEYKHKLKKGDKIVLTAFGAGFTWGASYLVWAI